jgi:hypothetical protein
VLGSIPTPGALTLLIALAQDAALTEEACQAIVRVVATDKISDAEARKAALELVVAQAKNDRTRKRAEGLLKMP